MSIFSNISNAVHTFVGWVEKEYATFMKEAPTVEHYIEQGVTYATGVLKIVLAQVEAGSPAANALTKAIQDLLTVSAIAYDAGAHPSLGGLFQVVISDLSGIESLAGIKNANLITTISKVVSTLQAIVTAVLAIAPVA